MHETDEKIRIFQRKHIALQRERVVLRFFSYNGKHTLQILIMNRAITVTINDYY